LSNVRGDEWYTPKWFVEALGNFDLDPAAPRRDHWTATHSYTREDDGLALPWYGRVFLNPPYSDPYPWVERLVEHGNAIALFFARTDTRWMQEALSAADGVLLIERRMQFVDLDGHKCGSAPSPSVLLAYGCANVEAIQVAQASKLIGGMLFGPYRELVQTSGSKAVDGCQRSSPDFANLAAD